MTQHKPSWVIQQYGRADRQGIRIIEHGYNWHMRPASSYRVVAQWGPHKENTSRGHKKLQKAFVEAKMMVTKLEHAWPCTFLIKGYNYIPPVPSEADRANHKDKVA